MLKLYLYICVINKKNEIMKTKKISNENNNSISYIPQNNTKGSLPIEEVELHAADDWFDTAKYRSDVRADLKSYYEGYRDAMRFLTNQ